MMDALKKLSTPLTTGMFFAVGISGVMMFFHVGERSVKEMHEWLGVVMVLGALLHLWKNWRTFLGYFKKSQLMTGVLVASAVVALGFVGVATFGGGEGGGGRPDPRAIFGAMQDAQIEDLAAVFGKEPAAVVSELEGKGYKGVSAEATPSSVGDASGVNPMDVLSAVVSGS